MKGTTYFATASDGFQTSRYSARHTEPIYTHAVIVGRGDFRSASYCSRLALAEQSAASHRRFGYTTEVVPVVTKPGNHKGKPL